MTVMEIPCYLVRGGTSKGVFIDESILPPPGRDRDLIILKLMGSPDIRQIDGLGGADPLTSKVTIISRSAEPGCEVNFLSGEVRLNRMEINYGIMCGNMASAVALVAGDLGFVSLSDQQGIVNVYNHNSRKRISAKIESDHGYARGAERKVNLTFNDPGGAVTGVLLPTGRRRECLQINGMGLECSIVDAGTLYSYVRAASFGLRGDESPLALDQKTAFKDTVERLRSTVAEYVNGVLDNGRKIDSGNVKVAIVSESAATPEAGFDCDIVARIVNPEKTHKAFAISGAVCLGAAAALEGTLVSEIVAPERPGGRTRIGHPGGVMDVSTRVEGWGENIQIGAVEVYRTARILMKGTAYVVL